MAGLLRGPAQGVVGREGVVPAQGWRPPDDQLSPPGGRARLVLSEGFCHDPTPCVPSGSGAGTTPFGDREAELIATTDPAGFAAVVDEDQDPSWLLTGTAIDEAEFRTIAAALHLIDE